MCHVGTSVMYNIISRISVRLIIILHKTLLFRQFRVANTKSKSNQGNREADTRYAEQALSLLICHNYGIPIGRTNWIGDRKWKWLPKNLGSKCLITQLSN